MDTRNLADANGQQSPASVLWRGETRVPAGEKRRVSYPTFPLEEDTLFESHRILMEPRSVLTMEPQCKGATELVSVTSGQVELTVDGACLTLVAKESNSFPAGAPHTYRNTGAEPSELSILIRCER